MGASSESTDAVDAFRFIDAEELSVVFLDMAPELAMGVSSQHFVELGSPELRGWAHVDKLQPSACRIGVQPLDPTIHLIAAIIANTQKGCQVDCQVSFSPESPAHRDGC